MISVVGPPTAGSRMLHELIRSQRGGRYFTQPLPDIQIALATDTITDWILLVRALYGNDTQTGYIEREGAKAHKQIAEMNIRLTAKNPTGRLASSLRIYRGHPNRGGGRGIKVNRPGDYSRKAGKKGGVRYGTAHHQGHGPPIPNPPTKFFYEPIYPLPAIERAMRSAHDRQLARLITRARTITGMLGARAQAEMIAKLGRAGARFSRGRGGPAQGRRAMQNLRDLAESGALEDVAKLGIGNILPISTLPTNAIAANTLAA